MPFTYKRTEAYQGQLFNPATFQPLEDQVLVLPDDAPAMRGVIHIPESARVEKNERGYPVFYRTGVVVKVGPGDRAIGLWCLDCRDTGRDGAFTSTFRRRDEFGWLVAKCPRCGSSRTEELRTGADGHRFETRRPMQLQPGDHILYLVRPGSEVVFEGKEYMVLHEDAEYGQHVLGIIE